jgi:hypothetical protein
MRWRLRHLVCTLTTMGLYVKIAILLVLVVLPLGAGVAQLASGGGQDAPAEVVEGEPAYGVADADVQALPDGATREDVAAALGEPDDSWVIDERGDESDSECIYYQRAADPETYWQLCIGKADGLGLRMTGRYDASQG